MSLGPLGGLGAVHARRGFLHRGCRCPGPAPPHPPGRARRAAGAGPGRAGPRGAVCEAARAGAPYITTGNGERGGKGGRCWQHPERGWDGPYRGTAACRNLPQPSAG